MNKIFPVAIIGAGPSGIACGIQLKRYGIKSIIFEKDEIGGLLNNACFVENYPGFPNGIKGQVLVKLLIKQIKKYRLKIIKREVLKVFYKRKRFFIETRDRIYQSIILVAASGTRPKKLPIPIPKDCARRIFYEVKNLKNLKGKKICIIGGGDAAFDYAMTLSKNNQVVLLHRRLRPHCIPVLYQGARKNRNISYLAITFLKRIENEQNGLRLICNRNRRLLVDYLVIAIGREPELSFLSSNYKNLVKRNKLYIIGDAKNGIFRQIAIAAGDGIKTAMEIMQIWSKRCQGD